MKKKIYIFGNPLLEFDNLPLKLLPQLKKRFPQIDFAAMDPNENINPPGGELVIIDTAKGINQVTIFRNLDKIQLDKIYSAHDFDLGFNLKLLQKTGRLKKLIIFGVPQGIDKSSAWKELTVLIKRTFKSS